MKCAHLEDRYVVPLLSSIPESLRNLSLSEVCALRPFELHCGDYRKHEDGYRQKNGMSLACVPLLWKKRFPGLKKGLRANVVIKLIII